MYIYIHRCFVLFICLSPCGTFHDVFGIVGKLSMKCKVGFFKFLTNWTIIIEFKIFFVIGNQLKFTILIFSTNQYLFMPHEKMHLPLHAMGKCMGISHWPSSHLTISSNQCLFMSYEEMPLFFHRGKDKESFIDNSISILNPSICPFTSQTLSTWG
jgi:hypothetical protein